MFFYFIKNDLLDIYYKDSIASLEMIEEKAQHRVLEDSNKDMNKEYNSILGSEVYVNVKDLKKLYANKCIVLPNSLLANI